MYPYEEEITNPGYLRGLLIRYIDWTEKHPVFKIFLLPLYLWYWCIGALEDLLRIY
jgi:hypothetical protein